MTHDHDHAPSETQGDPGFAGSHIAPPMIVLDNRDEPDMRAAFLDYDLRPWSPLTDYAIRLTDLYVAINRAFIAKRVTPDHDMMESCLRATLQSRYSEWITDPQPPETEDHDAPEREQSVAGRGRAAAGGRQGAGEPIDGEPSGSASRRRRPTAPRQLRSASRP